MKAFYNTMYGRFKAPWDIGPRAELVALVESGRLKPCRVIDLGSGTASNCVFLAQRGFTVTGVDFSEAAIALGKRRAAEAGVHVEWQLDDLTDLKNVRGVFDLLVDYGTLDDLKSNDRDAYVRNILPLTHPGTQFLLFAFEWTPRRWEKLLMPLMERLLGAMSLEPGEAQRRFGADFAIEEYARTLNWSAYPPGEAVYLMTRK